MSTLGTTDEYFNSFFLRGKSPLSFDYATFTGEVVNPAKIQAAPMSLCIKAASLQDFYRKGCLLVRHFISSAIILTHLQLSLLCRSASTPYLSSCHCDIHSSWKLEDIFDSTVPLVVWCVYVHKHRAPAVQVQKGCCRGEENVHSLYRLNTHRCPY